MASARAQTRLSTRQFPNGGIIAGPIDLVVFVVVMLSILDGLLMLGILDSFVMHGLFVMDGILVLHMSYMSVMCEPVGMMRAIGGCPVSVVVSPLGMMLVHPLRIVLMPPVSLVPLVVGTIGAPASVTINLSIDIGVILHELLQFRVVVAELLVENQIGISRKIALEAGMRIEKVVQARFLILCRRNRRESHCDRNDCNSQHGFELLHIWCFPPPPIRFMF